MLDVTPTAVLLPGEGSQAPGMRDLVARVRPDLLEAVLGLVGDDPFERIGESTRYAQPAIFSASLAGWARVADRVGRPVAFAGYALGELSALAIAGVLDELDALRLAVLRGRLMAECGEAHGDGTMLALLGTEPDHGAELAKDHGVAVASDIAPGRILLSGTSEDLGFVRRRARNQQLRTVPLQISDALHSPQMAGAVEPFRDALADVELHEPTAVVISCATAQPFRDPRRELADALTSPVRWRDTMAELHAAGARTYLDTGPGGVLATVARRCIPGAQIVTADGLTVEQFKAA